MCSVQVRISNWISRNFYLFSEDEKKLVDEVFNNAMNVLSEEDRGLPQVVSVLPLLRRGIGNKHALK